MPSGPVTLLLCLVVVTSAGCGERPGMTAPVEDLQVLDAELTSRHADLFHTVTAGEWEAQVDRLATRLPRLTDVAAALELRRLVATAGDGHTRVVMDGLLTRYPIVLDTVSDGVAVVAAAPEHGDLIGALVTEIGGTPIETAITSAEPYVSADNGIERRRRALGLVISPEFQDHVAGGDGSVGFLVDGAVTRRRLAAVPTADWLARVRGRPDAAYSWARVGTAIHVRYDRCVDDAARPFAEFTAEVFAAAADPAVDRLIVDLRRNPGGDSSVFEPFLRRLEGHRLDRPGRLFALIGPRTYSSAVLNAESLEASTSATLVGRPTGGAVNGYGETASFALPKSGLIVEYATRYFDVVDGPGDTLRPDVTILPASADIGAGRDVVLEWALAHGS